MLSLFSCLSPEEPNKKSLPYWHNICIILMITNQKAKQKKERSIDSRPMAGEKERVTDEVRF